MNLIEIRVRNFRSIEAEQRLSITQNLTLVGPNNSGKTNLLKAIQILFTGYDNLFRYSRDVDLTFGVGRSRTSIIATFDGDPNSDKEIYKNLDELHELQGTTRKTNKINLTLYFTDTNTPVYSFFPNVKRPKEGTKAAQFSRIHKALVIRLLSSFSLHYVPSAKSVNQIYTELVSPFLRKKVSQVIKPYLSDIKKSLSEAADALNDELNAANLSGFKTSFSLPTQSIDEFISGFDFIIEDPLKTPIHEKGMGIQTTALLAAFRWITKQETKDGYNVIWLLEEPESYLHPELAGNCNIILQNLAKDATVIKTTHSMAFVPQDPNNVYGTTLNKKNHTEIIKYDSFNDAVSSIRTSLGIKFADFYNLSKYNVFVEGKLDRELFQWLLHRISDKLYPWKFLRVAKFEDFGGVRHLAGFLRATYQFIRNERACVAVFDGDDRGQKERRDLQQYFGNIKIPFNANEHFVSVRSGFAIEGLFPDKWIIDIYKEHPNWFENYSVDASGELEPFKIKDNYKRSMNYKLVSLAEAEREIKWAKRFCDVCSAIDSALEKLSKKIKD